jgi:ParB-like chromosome segregation protein Spo0J
MDPFSLAAFAGGTILSLLSGNDEADRQEELAQKTMSIEKERTALAKETNQLQATRATRDAIRRAQVSRSMAVNFAANSGGGLDSSGVWGGIGQASGQLGATTTAISTDLMNAGRAADLNLKQTMATGQSNLDGIQNQFMMGLGNTIAGNSKQIGAIGRQIFSL